MCMRMIEAINQFTQWRNMKVRRGTVKGYDRELRNLCLCLRNPLLEAIELKDVMSYLDLMVELGWDHNTMIPKCMAIRKFFEFFQHQGKNVLDPWLIPIPRKEYKIPRVADEAQYQKLVASIPIKTNDPRHVRNLAIVKLLWDTGARNGELMSLDIGEVDVNARKAILKTEKSRGRRPVRQMHWSADTNDALTRWIAKREQLKKKMHLKDPDALFISVSSVQAGQRFTIKGVGEMLRRYSNKAGIPYMNAHSFRHSKAHRILDKEGSAADVQNILGHASLASSSIYTAMFGKELENRAKKFLDGEKVFSEVEQDAILKELVKDIQIKKIPHVDNY